MNAAVAQFKGANTGVSQREAAIARQGSAKRRREKESVGGVVANDGHRRVGRRSADVAEKVRHALAHLVARFTRPGRVRRGVLEVTVSNSTIVQELGFEKQRILAVLQAELSDVRIRDLRFRIGAVTYS